MAQKELGKQYLVVFCKGCGAGFRVRQEALFEGQQVEVSAPETHTCRGCGHSALYLPSEMRIARYQKEGLGYKRGAPKS